ncbi:hypothetical protein WICANDRAFT_78686 [Wickerhamomyces anomalus NRRL Y-366-8]|uniref:Major facilitator superfamily (MFS) profile domain-containing protein n=1 Tax=Wickerhamomyces anomalus (strain ATCC 58044 / CBS 1984 / NCYC 433 / NRRL Y-366-8) TaxID=683960 RepID=A0A1E3P3S3_WICAA|nr:uncharacterized protein WICANDRAFT_78686 [Wickerhamomyces anomalus NRRL Y-366-8]ODQ60065.1 hypothetical protein WICANDRAFT_78686 [Wickerhamomyces anomalus NRRL Y-366-8]
MGFNIAETLSKGKNVVPMEKRNKTLAYFLVLIATCLDNLNVAGTLTSVFSVAERFDASTTTVSWVFSSYALTLGAFIIIAGKLADVWGPHNVFLVGLFFTSLFALISAVIVKQIIALIVFRALQGVFAASLIPSAFSLTGNYFKGDALLKALAWFIMALTSVFGIGVILGGAFSVSSVGYKGLYYFTFAVGMACFIALYFIIIPIEKTQGHQNLKIKNLDYGGSAFLVIGLLLIILGLTEGGESWHKASSYVPLVVGVLVFFGVVIFEMWYIQGFKDKVNSQINNIEGNTTHFGNEQIKENQDDVCNGSIKTTSESPGTNDWRYKIELLFPREVIKIPNFFQYLSATFLFYVNSISVMSTVVQYSQYVELDSPIMAALKVLPLTLGLSFAALTYRQNLAQRVGTKFIICCTPIMVLTMSVWMSRLDFRVKNSYWKYECISQFIFGFGTNVYFQVYWSDIITGTPLHLQGVVSGILQTAGQIGICFGNTIIAALVGDLKYTRDYDARVELHHKFKKNFYLAYAGSAALFFVLLTVKGKKSVAAKDDVENQPKDQDLETNQDTSNTN